MFLPWKPVIDCQSKGFTWYFIFDCNITVSQTWQVANKGLIGIIIASADLDSWATVLFDFTYIFRSTWGTGFTKCSQLIKQLFTCSGPRYTYGHHSSILYLLWSTISSIISESQDCNSTAMTLWNVQNLYFGGHSQCGLNILKRKRLPDLFCFENMPISVQIVKTQILECMIR